MTHLRVTYPYVLLKCLLQPVAGSLASEKKHA